MRSCVFAVFILLAGCALDTSVPVDSSDVPSIVAPVVNAGEVSHKSSFNSLTSSPVLNWTESTDSNIFSYSVAVGTQPGEDDVSTWTNLLNLPSNITSLNLNPGQTYYISARAITSGGDLSDVFSSAGWVVDTSAPVTPTIIDDGSIQLDETISNLITWSGGSDNIGIDHYQISIGSSEGLTDIQTWVIADSTSSHQFSGISLSPGQTYYINVRPVDEAGNVGDIISSDGWIAGDYCSDKSAWTTYNASGTPGTESDPFLICNAEQLANISGATAMSSFYKLMDNIDLAPYYAAPNPQFQIGACGAGGCAVWDGNDEFSGGFDGYGYTIDNFAYNDAGIHGVALFGATIGGAVIQNLNLTNVSIIAGSNAGGLVGALNSGKIKNCSVQGTVSGVGSLGGLVGTSFQGIIRGSSFTGNVTGTGDRVGGIIGNSYHITTAESKFLGGLITGDDRVGGIAGDLSESTVVSSYSVSGTISGTNSVGGLVGETNQARVSNSYNKSNVSGNNEVGGIVGDHQSTSIIKNSYNLGSVSGSNRVAGIVGRQANGNTTMNSYSTGQVDGTGGAGNVGFLFGEANGNIINSYYLATAACDSTGASGACGTAGSARGSLADFYLSTNAPMNAWDLVDRSTVGTNDFWIMDGLSHAEPYWTASDEYIVPFSGTGTVADPYLLDTVETFNKVSQNPRWMEANFKVTQNLNFIGEDFIKIGGEDMPLMGSLDVDNKTLSNITHIDSTEFLVGVVGTVAYGGTGVSNLIVSNITIEGYNYVAGAIGFADSSAVSNIQVLSGTVTGNGSYTGGVIGRTSKQTSQYLLSGVNVNGDVHVGGVVGYNFAGGVYNAKATGIISGNDRVGGVVGSNQTSGFRDNYFNGSVTSTSGPVGGLIGYAGFTGVDDSYSSGSVTGLSNVGGAVGQLQNATISNLFAVGTVNGTGGSTVVGRLVGSESSGTINNSYSWASSSCDSTGAAGACNSLGLTQANLTDFYNQANEPLLSWDFFSDWQTTVTFPELQWEP